MNELPLIFLGGLLGSGHCLGMCGGFAVALGSSADRWRANLAKQLIYTLGRVFTYSVLGAAVGYAGLRLTLAQGFLAHAQAVLAIVAGVLLIGQGLITTGLVRWPAHRVRTGGHCLASSWFAAYFRSQGAWSTFCAGLMTGFLPCGLVYGFLALAAASGDVLGGMSRMAAFGAGTAPAMILAGCSANALAITTRQRMFRAAAWCVVIAGTLSLVRGANLLAASEPTPHASCPFCQ